MALTDTGMIYSWGSGDAGQLGTGLAQSCHTPILIKTPSDVSNWIEISAGEYHSAAVASGGSLFTWGLNAFGQLGHGDCERRPAPTRVSALSGIKTKIIACGQSFNLIVTTSTEVYSWGQNDSGQLGHGDLQERHLPTVLASFRGVTLTRVSCGGRHAAALDKDGKLWRWGENCSGCLGLGDHENRSLPVSVPGSQDLVLDKIACGYRHFIAVSALDVAEIQSRDFFLNGLLHLDEPLESGFCLYAGSMSAQYQPLSVTFHFFDRHGVPISRDPIFIVDPCSDERLREVIARLLCLIKNGHNALEQVRLLAMGVYYEMGGAHARLNVACERHVTSLIDRIPIPNHVVPLGSVRIGDARLRATLMKLVCDRIGVRCCLICILIS